MWRRMAVTSDADGFEGCRLPVDPNTPAATDRFPDRPRGVPAVAPWADAASGHRRDPQRPRPEPGDARSTAPPAPVHAVGPGHPRASRRDAGPDPAHRLCRALDAPRGLSGRAALRSAGRSVGRPHGAHARDDPPRHRPGCVGPPAARPAGHGSGPEGTVRQAPGRRGPRRGRGDGSCLRGRAAAHLQGARRPPPDALAGSGPVRAGTGGADRRAARPGAAAGACGAGAGRSLTRRSRRGWESRPTNCRPSIRS